MFDTRFRKLFGDVRAEAGRLTLAIAALVLALLGFGTVLGAWSILRPEIERAYLSTRPAHATLELPDGVDARVLALATQGPGVLGASARSVALARARVGEDWRPLLLFGVPDFEALYLNQFFPEAGAWPPPEGTVLLERSAVGMAQASIGERLEVRLPHGATMTATISGLVHDPGLAPAWQERSIYAYASLATLAAFGEPAQADGLLVRFSPEPDQILDVDDRAEVFGRFLEAQGIRVHELRVPPLRQHPHQRQMTTVLMLLLSFAALSVVLSAVVVATTLAGILARQVREIGILKTLGATTGALRLGYGLTVFALGVLAWVLAVPGTVWAAGQMSTQVATMLNFGLMSSHPPAWVLWVQLGLAASLPVLAAGVPIRRATSGSIREALDAHGLEPHRALPRGLPVPARNLLRRPRRLALNLGLLATGGALFTTALSVAGAWERNLEKMDLARRYDLEVRLKDAPTPEVLGVLNGLLSAAGTVEWWGYGPAAFHQPGRLDRVRSYPDQGHGSMMVLAPPADTRLIALPVLAGRWLTALDDGVVLNHVAAAQGQRRVGDSVALSIDGEVHTFPVVGVVEEIGAAGVVYLERETYSRRYGPARLARLVTPGASVVERSSWVRRIERGLLGAGANLELVTPTGELRNAVGDHLAVLIRSLFLLAVVFGAVGLLGVSGATSIAVVERTREIGVLKALGARRADLLRIFLGEATVVAVVSWVAALALAVPLAAAIEGLLGMMGFLAPLPFHLSWPAWLLWCALVWATVLLATFFPARRGAAITTQQALGTV